MLRVKLCVLATVVASAFSVVTYAEELRFNCSRSVTVEDGLGSIIYGAYPLPFNFSINTGPGIQMANAPFHEFMGNLGVTIDNGRANVRLMGNNQYSGFNSQIGNNNQLKVVASSRVSMSVAELRSGFKIEVGSFNYVSTSLEASRSSTYEVICSRERLRANTQED